MPDSLIPHPNRRPLARDTILMTTSDAVAERKVVRTLGLVHGNTIRARHLGRDIMAVLKGIVGGEIDDYTKMLAEAKTADQAAGGLAEANVMVAKADATEKHGTAEANVLEKKAVAEAKATPIRKKAGRRHRGARPSSRVRLSAVTCWHLASVTRVDFRRSAFVVEGKDSKRLRRSGHPR